MCCSVLLFAVSCYKCNYDKYHEAFNTVKNLKNTYPALGDMFDEYLISANVAAADTVNNREKAIDSAVAILNSEPIKKMFEIETFKQNINVMDVNISKKFKDIDSNIISLRLQKKSLNRNFIELFYSDETYEFKIAVQLINTAHTNFKKLKDKYCSLKQR